MDDEIRAAKEAAAGKSSELGGDGPVTQMRGALKVLKAELRQLSLRQACLMPALLQGSTKLNLMHVDSLRSKSAKSFNQRST